MKKKVIRLAHSIASAAALVSAAAKVMWLSRPIETHAAAA